MARVTAASQGAGTTFTQYVNVSGTEYLSVLVLVGSVASAATAAGDAILTLQPFRDTAGDPSTYPGGTGPSTGTSTSAGPALAPITLPVLESAAAVLVSSVAYVWARYRVAGLHAVQIQAKNNNVAALPVEINYDLG